jgi:hypothetical protein
MEPKDGWSQVAHCKIFFLSFRYLPNTNTFFEEEKIPIVSARHLFGQEYPEEYGKWKMEAFKQLISDFKLNRSIVTNLLCIGDSMLEMDAATNLNN